jgi:hypothetical protein
MVFVKREMIEKLTNYENDYLNNYLYKNRYQLNLGIFGGFSPKSNISLVDIRKLILLPTLNIYTQHC